MKKLNQLLTIIMLCACVSANVQARMTYILVKAGDAQSLLQAIDQANKTNEDPAKAPRLYILIPNGYYDLGDKTLTAIKGHNISLVGQSTEGTIIRNAPAIENEGIGKTATLLVEGTGTYLQDLTLKDELDYYNSGAAGRGVCLQDKGNHTICNRVRMLSYQDTYYTYKEDVQHYLVDSEIHGTVDFICGAGDVYFNKCTIVTEPRTREGKGRCVIAAPRTSETPWGFVFNGCTIRNNVSTFHYARGWHATPRCVWLNTTLVTPEKLNATRFDPLGMRTVQSYFKEYGTKDDAGRDIMPATNAVTFTCNGDSNTVETVMTREEAMRYSPQTVFPQWRPDKMARKLEAKANKLRKKML